jgi:hypothetical protein
MIQLSVLGIALPNWDARPKAIQKIPSIGIKVFEKVILIFFTKINKLDHKRFS